MTAPIVLRHPVPNPEWLGKLNEDILEPDLPIVDPHHHLWDHGGNTYFLDELLADVNSGHNIVSTVFLQCFWAHRADGPEAMRPVGETEFVASVAAEAERRGARTKICAGIVGHVDFRLGDAVDAVLAAHVVAGAGRFRGIRQITARHHRILASMTTPPTFGLMAEPSFRRGFAHLERHGLSFDAWLYHTQIDQLHRSRAGISGRADRAQSRRRSDRRRALTAVKRRRGFPGLARRDENPRHLPQRPHQAGRSGDGDQRLRLPRKRSAAVIGRTGGRVAAVDGSVHRGFRRAALHV